jgi:DNA-binding NarL/FixJ family response regulator
LVEDHAAFREALASFLNQEQDLEVVVTQAASLAEGRSISPGKIDVALIDIFLPDGDGIDLARQLRQVEPPLSILALTGSLDPNLEVLAKEAGADEVLYKAAGVVEIADAIKRVIERRAS